mgnify:CR=1 FL=1
MDIFNYFRLYIMLVISDISYAVQREERRGRTGVRRVSWPVKSPKVCHKFSVFTLDLEKN